MIERFGHEADLREALLARHDLPPEARHAVAVALARSLSAFATERGWLGEARCERINREVAERTALDLSAGAGAAATSRLVSYLRASHQLNAGLILRAILSGRIEFAQTAFADLSGLDHASVARAMRDPRAVADLHEKAGLPAPLLPAMHAVLAAWRETARAAPGGGAKGAGLSRRMIEHAIAACEGWESPEIRSVVALLTRFEAEAARDEARETTRAILAQATAREAAERRRIAADAAWREALEAHRRAESGTEARRWSRPPQGRAAPTRWRDPRNPARTDPGMVPQRPGPDGRPGGAGRGPRRPRCRAHRGVPREPHRPGEGRCEGRHRHRRLKQRPRNDESPPPGQGGGLSRLSFTPRGRC